MPKKLAITFALAVLVNFCSRPVPVRAVDLETLQALLARTILDPEQPLHEVQKFCDERIPQMPQVASAAEWEALANRLRSDVLQRIVYRGEAARWRDAPTRVEWLDTIQGGPGYRIKKLRFEILPGMWTCALLYQPEELFGKVPVILNVNGHSAEGKQYPPKQLRCINQAKRGMIALNVEWLGMGQLRTSGFTHDRMNQLDLCGTSGLAPFFLSMKRSIDILLGLEHADPQRLAVTGLSGGGWQTIIISSLDTRVKLTCPVAGYSSFFTRTEHLKDLGDSEQTPNDLATLVDYTHLTAMMAPRPTLLIYNRKDNCCFESPYALPPLLAAARPIFELYGKAGVLRSHQNDDPGTHNYEEDNREALYRMLGAFFYPGDEQFNTKEIPSKEELKTAEELFIELPDPNQDFHTLALALAESLPRDGALPKAKEAALSWQRSRRAMLRRIICWEDLRVDDVQADSQQQDGLSVIFWKLKTGGSWTVPGVEFSGNEPKATAILIADGGRASTAAQVTRLLDSGHRVLAIDPANLGESRVANKGMLFPLLVAAVGGRPLGVQAAQVAAVARWCRNDRQTGPVTLVAVGPRATMCALVAAGLEEQAIGQVELYDALGSLKEVIEQNWGANTVPELLSFGLLKSFDVKQIAALVTPRSVTFVEAGDRVKRELAELAVWYAVLGSQFDPIQ